MNMMLFGKSWYMINDFVWDVLFRSDLFIQQIVELKLVKRRGLYWVLLKNLFIPESDT